MNKILVVDDAPVLLNNIKQIISDTGYIVSTATSGKEAIDKAKSEKPKMIFMDIIMPEMDGYEACRNLSKDPDTKDIPVIFVTTKNQKADKMWAQMQGGKGFISKPYEPEQIIDQIKEFNI